MRSTILSKFIVVFFSIIALSFCGVSIVSYQIDLDKSIRSEADKMYTQATTISSNYALLYYSGSATRDSLTLQLRTIAEYNGTIIMMINTNGDIIVNTMKNQAADTPKSINNFDPTITGNKRYVTGTFNNFFSSDHLSVIVPVTFGFNTQGYVLIHKSLDSITMDMIPLFNTNYITMVMCMLLSVLFIVLAYTEVNKPIKKITLAVKEYGHGNLKYQLKDFNNDEIGRLAASLNYMSAQLDELEESQKKFVANVSHDFRSPLTSIKGYLEAILDGTIPYEMQEKYLNIIISETERLSKLTNNLLTLNSTDPKKTRLNLEPFDINLVIKRTIETFEGTCKDKNIQFDLTFADLSTVVNADLGKITQVLYNLIDNAIKFSHQNSTIFINVSERGEKAFVSVKDTGIGIPKESVSKIWDRFYKTDLSRGKDKKGTGLGLSIVKDIIKSHQENIDVISTESAGTEFTFSLTKYVEK